MTFILGILVGLILGATFGVLVASLVWDANSETCLGWWRR